MPRRPKPQFVPQLPAAETAAPPPDAPKDLGEAGRQAWDFLWDLPWVRPTRHRLAVERYARLTDVLAASFAELERAGMMQLGSAKQLKCHPVMIEIRQLSAELRALDIELAATPSSSSKAGVPLELPPTNLDSIVAARRRLLDPGDEDDFRLALVKDGNPA